MIVDHFYRIGRASSCPPDPAFEPDVELTVGERIEQMARARYGG